MKFTVITLFPELITQICSESIIGRAQNKGLLTLRTVNPRQFTADVHHKVDDTPYGGGPGMVMMCQPLLDAWQHIQPLPSNHRVMMLSPWGTPFKQPMAHALAQVDELVLICGHYEGVDARILELIPNLELLSLGDFVLTGGELPAACLIDAVGRLLPGVLGHQESSHHESFENSRLEYPQYTKPATINGLAVPDVLRSGNHQAIADWRRQAAETVTKQYRPDLLCQ
ncbi:MAG: tRNA (guanosine(37)-N1)-methyltransferase TrmD [Cyanobacteria bacterium HKST-UBA06]|nr:tRNA (guanosine(37)-N1)-methyltransferase TrmD [Cyanobacteria bacterium HKST-UBA05]MCA9798624.1 tRNA (guanosine(37)-N1)-methyltransferase TrmD [Cyanobacteria bacterium HKST-UBA04]MCA9806780.1 tRNA (guanosine(37)-N1)-methyltransferase TrmD [Cyanobacteria bacterium HKST-UBA06]MCA9841946.1 tRNA (guanosine(37)-N1)-methyltransferase TrmD [Cyanobacteria bacterium HKST-UBA03]